MKTTISVLAVLALSSQLALADAAQEPETTSGEAAASTNAGMEVVAVRAKAVATDQQIKTLDHDLGQSLQDKLDARMNFDLQSGQKDRDAIASVN